MQDNTKEQIWFQAVSALLSVPKAGAALDAEAKRVKRDEAATIPQSIPSSAPTPCTAQAKALPSPLLLFQHVEVLRYEESRPGWGTLSFSPPHIGEMAQTRGSSHSAANKPSNQQHPAADVGITHLTSTQLDDSISMIASMPCLHHLLK